MNTRIGNGHFLVCIRVFAQEKHLFKTVRIEIPGTEFGGTFYYNRTDHVFFQSLVKKNKIPFSSHGTGAIRWASAAMVYSSACGPSAPVLLDGAR